MAKKTQPKIQTLTDLHSFFKTIPVNTFTQNALVDENSTYDADGNETRVTTYCAVGQLRAAYGPNSNVLNDNSKAAVKARKTLKKLGLTEDALICANDGGGKGGPKTRVLKILTDRIRRANKKAAKTK